jgi:tetratricopeptide (TPR) repeat protein
LTIILAVLMLSSCTSGNVFSKLDRNLVSGDCPAAIALIDERDREYGSNNQLIYLLDAAMVNMQCGNLDAAQSKFRGAEDLAERLWTESISRNALSLVTNDTVLAYAGEDFERVMIHLMSAIGFLQAGQPDEALVEARRLDSLLAIYNDKYEKKNIYKADAFARYLSGMLREADGAWDEAFIDYRRAVDIYREDYQAYDTALPKMLTTDLVRAAQAADRMTDISDLIAAGTIDPLHHAAAPPGLGKVVFITFAGYAPQKVQDMVVVPTSHGPVGVAFPRMVVTPPRCSQGRLNLYGAGQFFESDLVLVEDVNRIAVKNLEDRKGRILAKAIARAVAKQVVIHSIARSRDNRKDERTVEAILNLINVLLVERADTRSWRTLPGRIYMTRVFVPAGTYRVALEACGETWADFAPLTVESGATRWLFRDLRYPVLPRADEPVSSQLSNGAVKRSGSGFATPTK